MTSFRGPRLHQGPRDALSWGILTALLLGWWLCLAPTQLGGPATVAIVDGSSMEPTLRGGDLVIARSQPSYAVGDLVMFRLDYGLVIHRITGGSATAGWTTQGDNREGVDPWRVDQDSIAGKVWFEVAGFGSLLAIVAKNPLRFGIFCAALCLLPYLPWRRRRIPPALAEVLDRSTRELRPVPPSRLERGVLLLSALAAMGALALLSLLGASHALASLQGLIAVGALAWGGGFAVVLSARLYDGRGMPEPGRSACALSGRLRLVEEFPARDVPPRAVRSAVALREVAERCRLPVLHRIDPATDRHEFLVVSDGRGDFIWRPR
ncbi:unannotated protein [freshwater metagenome]|uniref:Unannotated protein n=1 Tax=freshwater metagenome TaxID=449393 RepID=A0A6J7IM58_9ZZZZ|nr:hypothetical protein [Actinomycetota bacterium]MSW36091.1 hypothetical protein [Actinomycetota bacterium]